MRCLDQNPTVLSFCSVTHWSVGLYSHTHSPTWFLSPRPSRGTGSFDLVYFLLFSPCFLPFSGPPSGLDEGETSHTSSSCLLSPLPPNLLFFLLLLHSTPVLWLFHWPIPFKKKKKSNSFFRCNIQAVKVYPQLTLMSSLFYLCLLSVNLSSWFPIALFHLLRLFCCFIVLGALCLLLTTTRIFIFAHKACAIVDQNTNLCILNLIPLFLSSLSSTLGLNSFSLGQVFTHLFPLSPSPVIAWKCFPFFGAGIAG